MSKPRGPKQKHNIFAKAAAWQMAAASFLLAVVGAMRGTSREVEFTTAFFTSLFNGTVNDLIAGIAVILAISGTCSFLVFATQRFFQIGVEHIVASIEKMDDIECFPRACRDADIAKIVDCASSYFEGATDLKQTLTLHRRDPTIFTIYEDAGGRFLGYSCIVRLKQDGVKALERGEFSIQSLPLEYMRVDNKQTDIDIYIGAICSIDRAMTKFIQGRLHGRIEAMRPPCVYARAATDDGLRVLKRRGFSALLDKKDGLGDLFYREFAWLGGQLATPGD